MCVVAVGAEEEHVSVDVRVERMRHQIRILETMLTKYSTEGDEGWVGFLRDKIDETGRAIERLREKRSSLS